MDEGRARDRTGSNTFWVPVACMGGYLSARAEALLVKKSLENAKQLRAYHPDIDTILSCRLSMTTPEG